jgi:hypothetical protein
MMRISLTARLSLLFMLAVTAVLVLAGLSFNHLSQHHFLQLDRQTLAEKLSATRNILGQLDDLQQFDRLRPQLRTLLGPRHYRTVPTRPASRCLPNRARCRCRPPWPTALAPRSGNGSTTTTTFAASVRRSRCPQTTHRCG